MRVLLITLYIHTYIHNTYIHEQGKDAYSMYICMMKHLFGSIPLHALIKLYVCTVCTVCTVCMHLSHTYVRTMCIVKIIDQVFSDLHIHLYCINVRMYVCIHIYRHRYVCR